MRGYTLIEVVAAAALLGITLLASGGLLLQWHHTSRLIEERSVAEHALAQEMETVLLESASLVTGTRSWLTDADTSSGLVEAEGELRVERLEDSRLRRVLVSLRWKGGEASRETLLEARR